MAAMFRDDRLRALLKERNLSQSELARRVGISQTAVYKLVSGQSQGSKYIHRIAQELAVSPAFLMGESDDPSPSSLAAPVPGFRGFEAEIRPGTVELHEIDLAYGMGGTYLDDVPVTTATMQFSLDWLRRFTRAAPENLFFAHGIGDSMEPTINDRDIVLIDRSQDRPRMGDQIWAIAFGGVGMIKRLRPRPDGSVAILSDNPSVPEDRAVDDEMHVIGRVVAVVRKI